MKFATVMQIGPLQGRTVEILNFFFKTKMAAAAMFKKSQKSRYLLNGLTDLYEI